MDALILIKQCKYFSKMYSLNQKGTEYLPELH